MKFRNAVTELGVNSVFAHFDDFLTSNFVENIMFKFSLEDLGIAYGDTVYETIAANDSFVAFVEQNLEDYDWVHFALDEDSEANPTISAIGIFFNFKVELIEVVENCFNLHCTFETEIEVDFFIFKSELYCLPDDEIENIHLEDWNKHYFLASKTKPASFTIDCSVFIDEDFVYKPEDTLELTITNLLGSASVTVEHVDVDFPSSFQSD